MKRHLHAGQQGSHIIGNRKNIIAVKRSESHGKAEECAKNAQPCQRTRYTRIEKIHSHSVQKVIVDIFLQIAGL